MRFIPSVAGIHLAVYHGPHHLLFRIHFRRYHQQEEGPDHLALHNAQVPMGWNMYYPCQRSAISDKIAVPKRSPHHPRSKAKTSSANRYPAFTNIFMAIWSQS